MADVTTHENASRKPVRLDMTPMVDLAFLLVTFFMLTTTFSKPRILKLAMPDRNKTTHQTPVDWEVTLTLVPDESNRLFYLRGFDEPEVSVTNYAPDGLRKLLLEMISKGEILKKDAVFLIKPTDGASYQNIVDILDEMKITSARVYAIQRLLPEEETLIEKYKKAHSLQE